MGNLRMKRAEIITGDVLEVLKTLASDSVHCVVTSPPYWGLRDYGVEGQLGLEKTPEEYIEKMVEIFREVRRVLRKDGTLFLNLGDSYWGGKSAWATEIEQKKKRDGNANLPQKGYGNLKPKDLCMIPARVAIALQADGWWLRSDIIWHKPNPMPSSVEDRPTTCHEYLFLLTKSAKYYYDAEAVREPHQADTIARKDNAGRKKQPKKGADKFTYQMDKVYLNPVGRNKRSVWTIATQPFSDAHFATFPEKLVEPCILAGSSEVGSCPECGMPWERIVEKTGGTTGKSWHDHSDDLGGGLSQSSRTDIPTEGYSRKTIGWECNCNCGTSREDAVPCVVMDPFCGSGTTGVVALKHRRHFIGIELNPEYVQMAEKRMAPYINQPELAL